MIEVRNLFAKAAGVYPGEVCDTLFETEGVRIERIVSHSTPSPADFWYDQEQEEWILILQGEAKLQIHPDNQIFLKAGDSLLIPRHCRHRVEWTSAETIWLTVHVLPNLREAPAGEGASDHDLERGGA
jgi:cupin 2 domain-containing protein